MYGGKKSTSVRKRGAEFYEAKILLIVDICKLVKL